MIYKIDLTDYLTNYITSNHLEPVIWIVIPNAGGEKCCSVDQCNHELIYIFVSCFTKERSLDEWHFYTFLYKRLD